MTSFGGKKKIEAYILLIILYRLQDAMGRGQRPQIGHIGGIFDDLAGLLDGVFEQQEQEPEPEPEPEPESDCEELESDCEELESDWEELESVSDWDEPDLDRYDSDTDQEAELYDHEVTEFLREVQPPELDDYPTQQTSYKEMLQQLEELRYDRRLAWGTVLLAEGE